MADQAKTVFLFHGEDTYSSNQKLVHWKSEFIKKHGDTNVEIFDDKKLDTSNFSTNLEAMPFLSEKRMMIIKNIFKNGKKETLHSIAEAIERTPDFCIVIFQENGSADKRTTLYKRIQKFGKVEEFKNLSPAEISMWIRKEAQKSNMNISSQTASYLATHCGNELWRVAKEIEKLQLFAEGKEITQEMIDNLVTPALSASIFKLTDYIADRKTKESIAVLKTLKDSGEDLIKVFFMIVRHFRILTQVHDMIQKGEHHSTITKKMGQHPFVIQKTSSQSRNFTTESLKKIYRQLLEIDRDLKTGKIKIVQSDDRQYQLAIEKLIIDCCK